MIYLLGVCEDRNISLEPTALIIFVGNIGDIQPLPMDRTPFIFLSGRSHIQRMVNPPFLAFGKKSSVAGYFDQIYS